MGLNTVLPIYSTESDHRMSLSTQYKPERRSLRSYVSRGRKITENMDRDVLLEAKSQLHRKSHWVK